MFEIKKVIKKKLKGDVLIAGLPGIANVGKIAVDFLIDALDAKKVLDIESNSFPNSVFVNSENLVEMPKVSLYHVKKKQDILLLTGDVQPLDEKDCYDFCEKLIDLCEEYKCKNLITLGGIGLPRIPKKIKTYVTGSDKKYIKEFVSKNLNDQIFGVVGPIVGVTGLLIGLGSKRKMKGVSLLAQTYGHPNYLGIKGSKALLDILNKKLILGLDLKKLDKEIKELEKEIEDEDVEIVEEDTNLMFNPRETRYIG